MCLLADAHAAVRAGCWLDALPTAWLHARERPHGPVCRQISGRTQTGRLGIPGLPPVDPCPAVRGSQNGRPPIPDRPLQTGPPQPLLVVPRRRSARTQCQRATAESDTATSTGPQRPPATAPRATAHPTAYTGVQTRRLTAHYSTADSCQTDTRGRSRHSRRATHQPGESACADDIWSAAPTFR